jgi:hypothetical protein
MTLDRRTCEHQEFETYPADEFVYCKSSVDCEFKCKSMIGDEIYCDKPVISHHTAIEKAARKDEREKVLDEVCCKIRKYCQNRIWLGAERLITHIRQEGKGDH